MKVLVLVLVLALLGGAARAETVTVFAASSLQTALDEVVAGYEAAGGDRVVVSYGGSAALARQIVAGAPADIFISAAPEWMDVVEGEGLVQAGTRRDMLGNTLVLVGAQGRVAEGFDVVGLLGDGKLAMGLVDAVPAGQYGKQALSALGVWEQVAPQVVQVENVRQALALVARGEAALGVVYGSDAVAEPRVAVLGVFPEASHAPIVYPVAVIGDGGAGVDGFMAALVAARAVFERQGFKVLE
jgi:molybdate transport system substrate-binding protein